MKDVVGGAARDDDASKAMFQMKSISMTMLANATA